MEDPFFLGGCGGGRVDLKKTGLGTFFGGRNIIMLFLHSFLVSKEEQKQVWNQVGMLGIFPLLLCGNKPNVPKKNFHRVEIWMEGDFFRGTFLSVWLERSL